MKNLGFVLACVATVAALFLIAALFEKYVVKERKAFSNTHYITYTAIFASLAGVLMFIEIPLFFAPSFYKIDLSEIPVLICTFYLGPVAGVAAELLKVCPRTLIYYLDNGYLDRVYGCGQRALGVSRESLLRFMTRRVVRTGLKQSRHLKSCRR